jgi:nitrite reductase/ring-hydroxylating ferredoxin subunit
MLGCQRARQGSHRLHDGSIVQGPATAPQPCYDVRVRDGAVEVREPR